MRVLATLCALALVLSGGAARADARDDAAIRAIETRVPLPGGVAGAGSLAQQMADGHVPAVSIAVFENGRIRWTRAYGLADVAANRQAKPDTLFQAASMSKAVAAAGALRLVDQGRLSLDQDAATSLRAWRPKASDFTQNEKVTLRRLLSHTAGLTVSGFPGYAAGAPIPDTVQVLSGAKPAITPEVRSYAQPGAAFGYSGGGYTVAQLMMTEATGEPFPALMRRLVLAPAGMSRATFEQPLPAARRAQAATGYDFKGVAVPEGANTYPEYAAAGLWTTPSNYARFVMALQNSWNGGPNPLLRQSTARTMATPILSGYGLGVLTGKRGGRPTIEHGGSNRGFQCQFFAFLDGSRQGVVIMTNGDNGGGLALRMVAALAEAYNWGAPDTPPGLLPRAPYA